VKVIANQTISLGLPVNQKKTIAVETLDGVVRVGEEGFKQMCYGM